MMKKLIYIVLTKVIICTNMVSQTNLQDNYTPVINKVIETYNQKDYEGFYNLFSPTFKTMQSEKDIKAFIKQNVFPYYGTIKSALYSKTEDGFRHYTTTFEKATLDMLIACNKKMQIDGFTFQPHKDVEALKKTIFSDNKKHSKMDIFVDSIVSEYISNPVNSGISIGIINNGITTFYHYGEIKKGGNQLPLNNSVYEIGSLTKTFTGILLAEAVAEKKVNLNDDIRKYLPATCSSLNYKGTPITLKNLATHTSRLPRIPKNISAQKKFDILNPYKNYTKDLMYNYLSKLKLDTVPGIKYDYSNTGMALLGMLLENVYDTSFENLVTSKILNGLKMDYTFANVPTSSKSNFCDGYNNEGKETLHWDFLAMIACGGYKSTISDMTNYLNANIKEENAIKNSHLEEFSINKNTSIGLAWHILKNSDNTIIWHNGGTFGFSSFCGFIKEQQCGLVILSNSGNSVDKIAMTLINHLEK